MTTVFSSKILGNELASGIMSLLENGNCNPWNFGSVHMRSMSSLIQQYLLTLGYILFFVALLLLSFNQAFGLCGTTVNTARS
jgi:hypothetical protein